MDKTGIANLALGNLGEARIQNLNDNNSRARACNQRLDDVITAVLRMHTWNSALERATLANVGSPIFGWNYIFQLPSDCIKVVEVNPVSKFQVEKKNILSNESTLNLLYVANPLDISNLDSLLIEAIAMKLALEIAETLTSKVNLKQEMMQKYVIALQEARAANSHDKTPEHRERSSYLDAKRGRFSVPHRTFSSPTTGYEANEFSYSVGYNVG
jgi:hypothetical protein|tara:strand:+ start:1008 stop:1649 length:642 start_codon:yes stop_codon:yes gene_type:complete